MSATQSFEQVFETLIELDKLKTVLRQTKPVGLDRYENSAEHSWHVALAAVLCLSFTSRNIDIARVMSMLLIHDVGEIDASDRLVYAALDPKRYEQEKAGLARVFSSLAASQQGQLMQLWLEFEANQTAEAQYARAIDRMLPILHNLYGSHRGWRQHNIQLQQVLDTNAPIINQACPSLWQHLEATIRQAFKSANQHSINTD